MKSYCLRCRTHTEDVDPRIKSTKNNRWLRMSICRRCKAKKARFVMCQRGSGVDVNQILDRAKREGKNVYRRLRSGKVSELARRVKGRLENGIRRLKNRDRSQKGGALARRKVRMIDKVAEGMSMFLSGPAPSFAKLGFKLGSQGAKALKDVVNQYPKS